MPLYDFTWSVLGNGESRPVLGYVESCGLEDLTEKIYFPKVFVLVGQNMNLNGLRLFLKTNYMFDIVLSYEIEFRWCYGAEDLTNNNYCSTSFDPTSQSMNIKDVR